MIMIILIANSSNTNSSVRGHADLKSHRPDFSQVLHKTAFHEARAVQASIFSGPRVCIRWPAELLKLGEPRRSLRARSTPVSYDRRNHVRLLCTWSPSPLRSSRFRPRFMLRSSPPICQRLCPLSHAIYSFVFHSTTPITSCTGRSYCLRNREDRATRPQNKNPESRDPNRVHRRPRAHAGAPG